MFIRPISDIHNEFSIYNLPPAETDSKAVLILAGDIALADSVNSTLVPFLDSVTDRFTDILYIPGNHEFYHSSLARGDDKLEAACKRYSNVHYMNKKAMSINGTFFIGATLWTDYNRGDPMARMAAENAMNDFKVIRTGPKGAPYQRKTRAIDFMALNNDHRLFIEQELKFAEHAGQPKGKVVVFTHHGPSFMSRDPQYNEVLDYAYYNSYGLEDLMLDYEPAVWIHGHSHYPVDYMIGNTRVVSNPRGYSKNPNGYESLDFRELFTIEL